MFLLKSYKTFLRNNVVSHATLCEHGAARKRLSEILVNHEMQACIKLVPRPTVSAANGIEFFKLWWPHKSTLVWAGRDML